MSSDLANFYSRTRTARKVIVVDLGFLGDTIHLVPALWELKRNYPQAELHVLTSRVGAQVLQLAPCVDRAWALEMSAQQRTLREQWQIIRALRRERFDLAFNFTGADRTLFYTALTSARWRVAYPGGREHFYNRWLISEWATRQDPNRTTFEQRRQMLADCGLNLSPPKFGLRLDEASIRRAAELVPLPAVHLSVSASKPTREWPIEHHASFLRLLWADFPKLNAIASGSAAPRERERLRALADAVRDPRLVLLPPNLTIPELAAVVARCRLHIGPDSGVLHLAVALDVPTVSMFREQGAYRSFMPTGPKHQVILKPCPCQEGCDTACQRQGWGDCFASIEPAQVAQLVRAQLQ